MKKIIAITSCPTGIAHTFMAAEALRKAAADAGYSIKVETQGSVGAENTFSEEDIAQADVVIIAADTNVDKSRFSGKKIYETSVSKAVKSPASVIEEAFSSAQDFISKVESIKSERKSKTTGAYRHLLTGVSFMIPFVVAGGVLIAISFAFGIEAFRNEGTFPAALMEIGGGSAFALMIPILAGYIAYSIADRPGIAPGMVGGMLAASGGSGFLGGIIAGFLAGYIAKFLKQSIKLPKSLDGMKPVLIIPVIAVSVIGLLMIYVIGGPVTALNNAMVGMLENLSGTNSVLLGLLLGAMMAFDMGGPVNKAAYTFATGLIASGVLEPMAAVMAAGMTPPLGLALAALMYRNRFDPAEQEAAKPALFLGISFITEGAIPFAAKDPFRVIPSIMVGSAVTGALSMLFNVTLQAPHGGIFVLAIPNVINGLFPYVLAILIGTVVTAVMVGSLKKGAKNQQTA